MNRISTVVWLFVIVIAAFMLYKVKYEVQTLKSQVAETSRQLEMERQSLHVVAAEWAYLNRPERLQKLAVKYLAASEVTVSQISDIQEIPFPGQTLAAMDPEEGIKPVPARYRQGR